MPTLNQISNLPFENNLILNSLSMDDKSGAVYDFSDGYNVIDFIVSRVGGASRRVDGADGIFYKPIMGRSHILATVATRSASGNLLTLTFTDPNFTQFRLKEVLGDSTAAMNKGRVIQKSAGTVVLEAIAGSTTWSASQFAVGSTVVPLFPASGARGSTGMDSLYEYPKYTNNRPAILRESLDLYRRDASKTWVNFQGDYWHMAQEPLMMRRLARALDRRALWSEYGETIGSTLEGDVPYTRGLKQSIQDPERGGIYQPATSLLTPADFERFAVNIADRRATASTKLTFLVGRGFLSLFQKFPSITNSVQYAGKTNTFGGESVKGLDVYSFAFSGVEVDLIMAPALNDRELWPGLSTIANSSMFTRMQYTAICIDTEPYESIDGQLLPAMEKFHFGENEFVYGYIPGMEGSQLKGDTTMFTNGNLKLAVTDKDVSSMQVLTDSGHDFMARRMGWYELIA